MIATIKIKASVITGAQSLRSETEGVIQFNTVVMPIMPVAGHMVQRGQCGQYPSVDKTAKAIAPRIIIETAAAIRPVRGKAPSIWPPWVSRPQGAPKINAN